MMENNLSNFPKEKGKLLYVVLAGSRAYGTDTPTSDTDVWGVYSQNNEDILMGNHVPLLEVTKDEKYYEISNFLNLVLCNNPTVLEMLYVSNPLYIDESFIEFRNQRDSFLTKKILDTFGNYAKKQIQKASGLNKKQNMERSKMVRKSVLDFCWILNGYQNIPLIDYLKKLGYTQEQVGLSKVDHFTDTYCGWFGENLRGIVSENGNDVRLSNIPKELGTNNFVMSFQRNAYSLHCKEYKEYCEWLEKRNEERYVDYTTHGQSYDGKNILHCVRLLRMVKEVSLHNTLIVDRRGIDADYLLSIRKGGVVLKDVIEDSLKIIEELDSCFEKSSLPDTLNYNVLFNHWLKFFRGIC